MDGERGMEEGDVGGMRLDRDERKVFERWKKISKERNAEKEKENKRSTSQALSWYRGETELCRGRKRGGIQREKSEVHRGTSEWRKEAEGGKEVFTREPRSKRKKDGWMNGGMEERRNNENSRQGCWPQIPLDRSEVSATQPGRMSGEGKLNKTTE